MKVRTRRYLISWLIGIVLVVLGGLIATVGFTLIGVVALLSGLTILVVSYFLWYWQII